jgi:hypothetical protein
MQIWNLSASFTRPSNTTAYAVGSLVANSVTAGSVVPMSFQLGNSWPIGQFRINRARLNKSGTGVSNAAFRIHLYETPPTPANGDGGAWLTDQSLHWLGNIDVGSMLAFSDGAQGTGSLPAGSEGMIRLAAGKTLYGLLSALGAYAPAANEVFTAVLETLEAY